jgi:glutamate synthase (ferredoxin)
VIAAILGADEYSFGTMALMAEGCIMARVCQNNTCPVGVTTQREILRKNFTGLPEHIITYMHYVAEDVREILAQLGFRSLGEIIGRTELLKQIKTGNKAIDSLDLSPLLVKTSPPAGAPPVIKMASYVPVNELNQQLLSQAQPAVETGEPVQLTLPINNTDRAVGSTLSGEIAKRYGDKGLPEGTISVTFHGSAGQSLGAFNVTGLNLTLIGEANDYVGKGMNGGQIVVRPPLKSRLIASDNTIVGNTLLYGATGGALFANGQAGERFAVRNSGATAVVEGLGDHGCEYMTGGVIVVLGHTGYNFGAGMSGGMAFVLDEGHHLPQRLNSDMVEMARITNEPDITLLRHLITRHVRLTGSVRGQAILDNWTTQLELFWKVAPHGTLDSTSVHAKEVKVALPMPELSQHVAA